MPSSSTVYDGLTCCTVYDGLACVRGFVQSLFVLLRHVCLERRKSTPLGRGSLYTLFVPPFRGLLMHSSSSRSPLGDGSISRLENHVPNVLKISVYVCVSWVNCPALLIQDRLEQIPVCPLLLVFRSSINFCKARTSVSFTFSSSSVRSSTGLREELSQNFPCPNRFCL